MQPIILGYDALYAKAIYAKVLQCFTNQTETSFFSKNFPSPHKKCWFETKGSRSKSSPTQGISLIGIKHVEGNKGGEVNLLLCSFRENKVAKTFHIMANTTFTS